MTSFKDDLVGDINHTYLSVKFELRKHLRRKRLLMAVALAVLIPLIFYAVPLIAATGFAETANTFASTNLAFASLLIVISSAIFAGDAVSSEFEKKTGLLLFPTPQRRTSIFVGKYIAAMLATFLVISLYYLVTALEIMQIYGVAEMSMEILKSFLLALLYSTSTISVIFFFSATMKRTLASTLIGFFLLMMILPIVSTVLAMVEVDPWFLVTHSADLMTGVLGTSSAGGLRPGGERGMGASFSPDFYVGIYVMAAYTIAFFLLGTIIAHRRNME